MGEEGSKDFIILNKIRTMQNDVFLLKVYNAHFVLANY